MKFTQEQLEVIKSVGKKGLSIGVAASELNMLKSKFMEAYHESEEAQLAYEKGLADLEKQVNTVAHKGMLEGDAKKFEYFTKDVLNMSGKGSKQEGPANTKKVELPKLLFNPDLLLEIDDEELERRMHEKANIEATPATKEVKKHVKKSKEENEDDE